MESRMEKYGTKSNVHARSERNKKLYEEINNLDLEYSSIDMNNAIELSEKKEIKTRSEYQRRKEFEQLIPSRKETEITSKIEEKENRVYDINEILKLAKENKLFDTNDDKKRLINTEYNILTKLDIDKINQSEEYSKDALKDLINSIYKTEEENNKKEENLDLFDNLKANDLEISEDLSLKVLDKIPHEKTELIEIIDEDEETDEEETKESESVEETDKEEKIEVKKEIDEIDFEIEKTSIGTVILIIFVVALFLAAGFVLYKYFFK